MIYIRVALIAYGEIAFLLLTDFPYSFPCILCDYH